MSIYNEKRLFEREICLIENSSMNEENKKIILEYKSYLIATRIGILRTVRYIMVLRLISEKFNNKTFSDWPKGRNWSSGENWNRWIRRTPKGSTTRPWRGLSSGTRGRTGRAWVHQRDPKDDRKPTFCPRMKYWLWLRPQDTLGIGHGSTFTRGI